MTEEALRTVLDYHRRTKHHPQAYARGPGFMDWANQPEPFRFYPGRPPVRLPLAPETPQDLVRAGAAPVGAEALGALLGLSLGLSAWKSAGGARWALRINPSSGNLHPTEAHLLVPPGILPEAGLCHYNPLGHMLEPRATLPAELWRAIEDHFGGPGLLLGFTSVFWREAWKYGERAWRYCQLDIGHALAALDVASGFLGWGVTALTAMADDAVAAVLGLDRTVWPDGEAEHPEVLCWVHPADRAPAPRRLPEETVTALGGLPVAGAPNRLSPTHVDWEIIPAVAAAARRPAGRDSPAPPPSDPLPAAVSAPAITPATVRRRRSAQAFDARARIPLDTFGGLLEAAMERPGAVLSGTAEPLHPVGLLLFVHRVDGLPPGLYWFARRPAMTEGVRRATSPDQAWQPVDALPELHLLEAGDVQAEARRLACHQDIAADGVFSLAMLAAFRAPLERGAYRYRELFWACGMIGQALYLAAEACNLRGTGIGCFFDDAVHRRLGLADDRFQVLYHFTVGAPLADRRIATHPPYAHLEKGGDG